MMLSESTVKVCTSPFIRKTFLILSSYLASAHTDCLNLFLKNLLLRFAVSEAYYKLNFLPVNNVFKNSFIYLILYKNCSKPRGLEHLNKVNGLNLVNSFV